MQSYRLGSDLYLPFIGPEESQIIGSHTHEIRIWPAETRCETWTDGAFCEWVNFLKHCLPPLSYFCVVHFSMTILHQMKYLLNNIDPLYHENSFMRNKVIW